MSALTNGLPKFLPLLALLGVSVVGCGSNESSPDPAKHPPPPPATTSQAVSDPDDTSVTAISLSTSAEYSAEEGRLHLFGIVKDQAGDLHPEFNTYNFGVLLAPEVTGAPLDPSQVTLTRASSLERSVALVIDSSGSMSGPVDAVSAKTRLDAAKEAAKLYVSLMQPGDRAAVVTFSDSARTVQGLTDRQDLLGAAIDSLSANGATNFGGAVQVAVGAVGTRPGKRAMILLTDGDDTVDEPTGTGPDVWLHNPSSTRYQGLAAAKENDFRIYTVGLGSDLSEIGLADLSTFAVETGGTFFPATSVGALTTAFGETIPDEIASLPPVETYVLSCPVPFVPRAGETIYGSYGVWVKYVNGTGTHTDYSGGAYQVP